MTEPLSRRQFADLLARPDSEVDLAAASLLIAAEEYPGLDVAAYTGRLDAWAATLLGRLEDLRPFAQAQALNRLLFEEQGFHGNVDDYYDPRNSFLNEVLDRRTGIPITLSAVYMEVGRRAGLDVQGVGLPGHFIVRVAHEGEDVLVDPFHDGAILSEEDCQKRLDRVYEGKVKLDASLLAPCEPRAMLARMLRNLKEVYLKADDFGRALNTIELLLLLDPARHDELRDRGLVHEALDCYALAARDFEAYLARVPGSKEAGTLLAKIEQMRKKAARLN